MANETTKQGNMSADSGAHHEGTEFQSIEDELQARGETADGDVPEKDGVASDADAPAEELHGSLHGNWSGK